LDEFGNMEFNDKLFGNTQKFTNPKFVGDKITQPNEVDIPDSWRKLLDEKGLTGDIFEINQDSKSLIGKKRLFQINSNGTFYKVQLSNNLFFNSIDIIQVSKTPFI
jgi:hypothetical protein